ncbi:MAG: hypothetical protein Q9180_005950, partial [Flavoplaca navasiana]
RFIMGIETRALPTVQSLPDSRHIPFCGSHSIKTESIYPTDTSYPEITQFSPSFSSRIFFFSIPLSTASDFKPPRCNLPRFLDSMGSLYLHLLCPLAKNGHGRQNNLVNQYRYPRHHSDDILSPPYVPTNPGYDADTEDNNDWMDKDAEMDMQMPHKPSSSVASPVGANANGGATNGMSGSDPNPLAPEDAESVAGTDNMDANEETITDSVILSEINFDSANEPMQTDNINIMAGSSPPPSVLSTPSPSLATPTVPTVQMKKPWKSSITVHNGTAILHNGMKPSIASMSGAWTTPSDAAGAGNGNGNGSVPFTGAAHSLSVPFGVYIWGLVSFVMSVGMLGVW